jgi:hypothetical protein
MPGHFSAQYVPCVLGSLPFSFETSACLASFSGESRLASPARSAPDPSVGSVVFSVPDLWWHGIPEALSRISRLKCFGVPGS